MTTTSCQISASPGEVFAVLADGWLYSHWVVGTSYMRAVEPEWPAVGSKLFHCTGSWPLVLQDETEVLECEPDRRLVLQARGRPFGEARITVVLTPTTPQGPTSVAMTEVAAAGPARWLPRPAIDPLLAARNRQSLHRLTTLVERPRHPTA